MTVPMKPIGIIFRVGGLTLTNGDEIPPEFESLAPELWRTVPAKEQKIKAEEKE